MAAARLPLVPLVVASGLVGLGYELIWTRVLSTVLGQDMLAVLGVLAAFFVGLALGGFVLDGPIRRARTPGRVYAALEATIGGWALVCIWLLPAIGRLLPILVPPDAPGWRLWAVSFALPSLALLPATVAMGGTLAALERLASSRRGQSRRVGFVVGANTLGGVAGVVASMFLILPALGLSGGLALFAAVNAACAVAALAFRRDGAMPSPPPVAAAGAIRRDMTLFATGLLGIGYEVLIVRVASQVLEDTVFTFACLLAVYLVGAAAGGLAYQRLAARRMGDGVAMLGTLLLASSATCLLGVAVLPLVPGLVAASRPWGTLAPEIALAGALFLAPTLAMGALFAHLAQMTRDARGSLGRATGINALGAAAAPLLICLVSIPALGARGALLACAGLYLALVPPRAGRLAVGGAAAALAAAILLAWHPGPSLVLVPDGGRLLASVEGPTATASVVEDANANRYLEVNGHFRMGGTSSRRSDWRQALLPLLLHPNPRSALFLGVGTGATLDGAARFPDLAVTGVELLPEVAGLLPWFAGPPGGAAPPVAIADARRFVRADTGTYDVIVADLFHPALDGSGALYTVEHFLAARARLAPGGVFCQWLPLHQLDLASLRAIARTFLRAFPDATAYLAHYSVQTPLLALVGGGGGRPLDVAGLARRLEAPAPRALLRVTGVEQPIDLLGLYVGAAPALAAFAGDGPLNTDDAPFVTFDAVGNLRALAAPPAERLLALVTAARPDAASLLGPLADDTARRARLDAYWRARDRFLAAGAGLPATSGGRALIDAAVPGLLDVVRLSADFDPAYEPLLAMASALSRDDRDASRRLLAALVAAAPDRPEARRLLNGDGP